MTAIMFDHALKLYEYMEEHAEDGVYTGTKTGAFRAVGVPQTYYTSLFKTLEEMGSTQPLYVGGRGRRVHIRLVSPPEPDVFARAWEVVDLTKREPDATVRQQLEAIRRRLPDVDIRSVLLNFEKRLSKVEKALDKTKGE